MPKTVAAHTPGLEYNWCYVDIPTLDCINNPDGAWKNCGSFPDADAALAFAKEHFGADAAGRVRLVSGANFSKQDALEAAAPELLAALEAHRDFLQTNIGWLNNRAGQDEALCDLVATMEERLEDTQAAIAKAKGESQ